MDANAKRYLIEFGGAMATYSLLLPLSMWILHGHEHTALGYSSALMPTIPSAFALPAILRFFRGLDELQRRIQLEAVVFSFLGTCFITLTWAFQQKAGLPRFDVSWVASMRIALWGIGVEMAKRR